MKKYFVVADVHGYYNQLKTALDEAGFDINNPEHILISLGDLLDRGEKPLECLRFVNGLASNRKILIRGNHEDLTRACFSRSSFGYHDYSNGTADTILRLGDFGMITDIDEVFKNAKTNPQWLLYEDSLVDFAEIGDKIFVHGWIPCFADDENMYHSKNVKYTFNDDWRVGNWERARWINGMDAWNQGVKIDGKTVFCGHWHTSWARAHIDKSGVEWDNDRSTNTDHRKADFSPWVKDGIVALDACTAYSHKINVYTFEED